MTERRILTAEEANHRCGLIVLHVSQDGFAEESTASGSAAPWPEWANERGVTGPDDWAPPEANGQDQGAEPLRYFLGAN
jgi:hypothetical protein